MRRPRLGERTGGERLRLGLVSVLIVVMLGTLGFMLVEHLNLLEALYTTIGLMSTEGGLEGRLTPAARILSITIVIVGIAALFYTLGALAEYLIEGHFGRAIVRRRMDRKIEQLQGHAIICGYGRVGRRIAQEFSEVGQAFVVVDVLESNADALNQAGYLFVQGDASADATLSEAGIMRARVLLAATDQDTENIAITLSARALKPSLWIVARANREESEPKLRRAGADRVLLPYALGGHRMAGLARRPHLVDFLDTAMAGGDLDLALEEVEVDVNSRLVGVPLPASADDLPPAYRDWTIIAIRPTETRHWIAAGRREGAPIVPGDFLIVLGPVDHMRAPRQALKFMHGATPDKAAAEPMDVPAPRPESMQAEG